MRHFTQLFFAAASFMICVSAYGDIGDQLFKLLANDGAAGDHLGYSVAISGNMAVVGAIRDDDNGSNSGSAYIFDTATGQQLFKLLPIDGAEEDRFGNAIAIDNSTVIVGASQDDDNGNLSGSAYIFDSATGQQLFKLVPIDGAEEDYFGVSVAISGTTAIVGAMWDDDNGPASGSAYLFDTNTGQQLIKLLPEDGEAYENFGYSVAISGNTAIVGAYLDDDGGTYAGSAYLFDVSTGQQIAKLLPSDAENHDWFGYSVAISGTTAVVGSFQDDTNGTDSGSAYLFDTITGQQFAKLLPGDGAADDKFGRYVAIKGTTIVIGAWGDDDHGNSSGSAYLFDAATGDELAKLLPNDGAESDSFGQAVAISDTTAIIGALLDDDNGSNSGSAYLFEVVSDVDTDGDGLLDSWETNGLDINGDGTIDLDLPTLGANPMHKDLFIEVDIMQNVPFSPNAMQDVIEAFWAAPIDNPDNDTGVDLHIDWENADMIGFHETWGDDFLEFDVAKGFFFGTSSERDDPNWEHIQAAKKLVYRYCIFANRMDDGALGIAELPGNDFYVTLGGIANLQERVIASTFMHEFGHNLNLHHGGMDDVNHKPNYISVMNYNFDNLVYDNGEPLSVDFSRELLLPLNEANIDETIGIQSNTYSNVMMFHGYRHPGEAPQTGWVQLNKPFYDWDHDGTLEQGVPIDLNWFNPNGVPSPGESMNSYNDWDLIVLPLGTDGDYADLVHNTVDYPELDEETFHWMRDNIPPAPVNVADLTGVQMISGTIVSGDIADLQQSDQSYVQTRSDFGQKQVELIVTATTDTQAPATLSVLIESRIDQPLGSAELSLRNWTTGQFDSMGQFAIGASETTNWLDEIDAEDYVDGKGEIDLSIKFTNPVPAPAVRFTFDSFIDRVQITALN